MIGSLKLMTTREFLAKRMLFMFHMRLFIQVRDNGEHDGVPVDNEFQSADYSGANV